MSIKVARLVTALLLSTVSMILFAAGPSAEPGKANGNRMVPASWKWQAGDDAAWAAPSYDDSSWLEPGGKGLLSPLEGGDVFWLRSRVPVADIEAFLASSGGDRLYFLSGMAGCAFELHANGTWLGVHGRMPPDYDVRRTLAEAFLIPSSTIRAGNGDLVLALRCSWPGSSYNLRSYELGDAVAAGIETGSHNFWNGGFYVMLAALCAFLGLYFGFVFIFKTSARENLFFALSLILLSVYFYEMGSAWLPFASLLFEAFARACLVASVMLLYCFFSLFFRFKEKRMLRTLAIILAFAFCAAFLLAARDPGLSDLIFNLGLLPIFACLVYGIVAAISCVKRGEREAIPLLVGMAFGSYFAVHDIYWQLIGKSPFAWLQGMTFFSLDAAIFIMLSMRQARLGNEIAAMAARLETGKAELESSVVRLVGAGDAVAAIGRELEEAVERASASTEVSERRTAGVLGDAASLAERAKEAGALVGGFVSSIAVVNGKLAEEAAGIERTAAAAAQLQAGVESSASIINQTALFADSLASLTDSGERVAETLGGAMTRVVETARGIREVVDAVNEFAERTNLLAMNASIEAAHVGQAGKGFGVIAGEVKKLAAAQSERAGHIATLAREIGERLGEGGRDTEKLRETLRNIAQEARLASDRMAEAKAGALEQAKASAEVREAMESLAEAVAAIRDESERQSEYSGKVHAAVDAMVQGASDAKDSAAAIAKEGSEIARAVRNLRGLAERSLSLTLDMRRGSASGRGPAGKA